MSANDDHLIWSKSPFSLRVKAFCYTEPNDPSVHRNCTSWSTAYLGKKIYVKIIILWQLNYTSIRWSSRNIHSQTLWKPPNFHSPWLYLLEIESVSPRTKWWDISYIYIHKHQFFNVDETQTYRHNTVYILIQPEQK